MRILRDKSNSEVTTWHFDERMSTAAICDLDPKKWSSLEQGIPSGDHILLENIINIPGVTCVNTYAHYNMSVHKGVMFSWEDIIPKVELILSSWGIKKEANRATSNRYIDEQREDKWINPKPLE